MANHSTRVWSERWHLAALEPYDIKRLLVVSIMIGLLFVLFHFQGNTTDVRAYGRSVFGWTIARWGESSEDFSHAWFVPLVSLGIIWIRRHELANVPKRTDKRGLAVIIFALILHWLAAKAQQSRVSLGSFILLLWGIPFYLWGWAVARSLIFPCAYLLFAVPMTFLDSLTFPLRIIVTKASVPLLNGLGIPAERSGTAIYSLAADGFNFDVADPCSGLRSLLAMTALTAVYAFLTQRTLARKWLLFLFSVPITVVGNIVRIVTTALVAQAFGQEIAVGLYHDYSGYIFFSISIFLMTAIGGLLSADFRHWASRWKSKLLSPTSLSSAY